jgi:hypothetical protein
MSMSTSINVTARRKQTKPAKKYSGNKKHFKNTSMTANKHPNLAEKYNTSYEHVNNN